MENSPPRRHIFPRGIRFSDIDALRHVNNVRFFDFLEDARHALLFLDLHQAGETPFRGLVVARHEIEYRRPLNFQPEPVLVETWVTGLRPVRFTLEHEVTSDGVVYASARSVMVAYDVERAAPRRLEEDELVHLKRYLAD
ncbi:thioesterase family protein [Nonomuraea longicatena]|uniref:Thioesterase family protein n=1 Tax=Nonomuraea longicatena TaxID=83682 RepID=A0ABN1NQC9_9ACTN